MTNPKEDNEHYIGNIPRGSKIHTEEGIITFHHLDGMYSYCTCDWAEEGRNLIHLGHFQPLEKHEDEIDGTYYTFKI